jgi:glycosidase
MGSLARRPIIYEINTWVWLHELSGRDARHIHLGNVPAQDWDALGAIGADAVWLMGVWERSPAGLAIAKQNRELQDGFRRVLPDLRQDDVVGSPYCVRRYTVDSHLGGPDGLAIARKQLADRGLRLILDFVPNHVAHDHPWVKEHPEYFIQGSRDDLLRKPAEFLEAGGKVFAHGRDPYFPPWSDVAQLNAFEPGLRKAAIESACSIADQCDGMRCDMAMLMMNPVFERTWGKRAGTRPETEYWPELIQTVRTRHPDCVFIAEAYWNLEWELQQQGFAFCYDKRLYDRLERENAESVRLHLCADQAYQEKLVRFIENHDEPRAADSFSLPQQRAAAVTIATLPGAKLFHQGQFEGYRARVPVFLRRRPAEPTVPALQAFYRRLSSVISERTFKEGEWRLCERTGWPGNSSHENLVGWGWKREKERYFIIVNLSNRPSQARVRWPWDDAAGGARRLTDVFSGQVYDRDGNELCDPGLYVDLAPWAFHFFRL